MKMKRSSFSRLALMLVFVLLLSLFVTSILGQSEENLLTNPGFENPYIIVPGEPDREVASGWNPWHVSRQSGMRDYENAQPEYAQTAPDTERIRSGSNAQKMFNTWFTHDGGVYQRVTSITPGTELRFSLYAYVWSSNESNTDISSSPGGILLQVGIDPTGGTDGTSNNIVWSVPVEQYDAYRQYSVIATAVSNGVTVFIRSRVEFPQANNFIYLDDAVLAATSDQGTIDPTATEVVVEPSATVTLIPPTATTAPTDTIITPEEPGDPTPTQESGTVPTDVPPIIIEPTATSPAIGGPVDPTFPSTLIHTVRRGDTVGRLAVLYGSTIEAIIEANNLGSDALIYVGQGLLIPVPLSAPATSTPSITPPVPVATPIPETGTGGPIATITYVVQPGDYLSRIAARYNTTVGELAQLNGIVNPNLIRVGQHITIPDRSGGTSPQPPTTQPQPTPVPTSYTVVSGDTLYRISVRFGVPLQRLADVNNIRNMNLIFVGQVLTIPVP